jgi:tRNA pseudouridine32 synthase/23S rRNA pseudouridine746 synthase
MLHQLFHTFSKDISGIRPPEKFTYPFFYTPDPLVKLASEQLKGYLVKTDLKHNFGLGQNEHLIEQGKMFGVLVVRNKAGKLGWLAAYSGKLSEDPKEYFAPPICDIHAAQSFYKKGEIELNEMSAEIFALEKDPNRIEAIGKLEDRLTEINEFLRAGRADLKDAKKARQRYRETVKKTLSPQDYEEVKERLAKESIQGQLVFKHRSKKWVNEQEALEGKLANFSNEIRELKEIRRTKSNALQREIFNQYVFLNGLGQQQVLSDCFPDFDLRHPPSGSGDCAAPKLLQFAYKNELDQFVWANFGGEQHQLKRCANTVIFILLVLRVADPFLDICFKGLM